MSLSGWERRRLTEIGEALARDDPAFAAMLAGGRPMAAADPVPRWLAVAFVATAALLLSGGLVLGDSAMMSGSVLVMMFLPVAWLVRVARDVPG